MASASSQDSPFKRDEPVSRSRKWILIVFYFWILTLVLTLVSWILLPQFLAAQLSVAQVMIPLWTIIRDPDYFEIYGFLMMVAFLFAIVTSMIVMTIQLRRISRTAKHCQEKRSFDVMAAAVRSQHFFWGTAAASALMTAIFILMVCFQRIPMIKSWEELVKREMARRAQIPQP